MTKAQPLGVKSTWQKILRGPRRSHLTCLALVRTWKAKPHLCGICRLFHVIRFFNPCPGPTAQFPKTMQRIDMFQKPEDLTEIDDVEKWRNDQLPR